MPSQGAQCYLVVWRGPWQPQYLIDPLAQNGNYAFVLWPFEGVLHDREARMPESVER